jgi:hypothetical protein
MKYFNLLFLFIFLSINSKAQSITDNLLLYYSLDNGMAIDGSGNGNDGSVLGANADSDRFGNNNSALSLLPNQEVNIPYHPSLEVQYPLSISAWVYFNSDTIQNNIFRSDYISDNYSGVMLSRSEIGRINLFYGGGLGNTGINNRRNGLTQNSFPSNRWMHIVGIINGPTDMEIYIDGCPQELIYGGSGPDVIFYSQADSKIGRNDTSTFPETPDRYLDGKIDEFYFWDRAITEENIQELYDRFQVPESHIDDKVLCDSGIEISLSDRLENVTWNDGITDYSRIIDQEGTYSFVGTYECYEITDTFTVEIEDLSLDLGSDIITCDSIIELEASGSFDTILWSTGEASTSIFVNQVGIYSAIASNECGEVTDTVQVSYSEDIEIPIASNIDLCEGDSEVINLEGLGFNSILWSTGSTEFEIELSDAGTYSVELVQGACPPQFFEIHVVNLPNVQRQETLLICENEPIVINGVTYDQAGTFEQLLSTVNGCDSLLIFDVILDQSCNTCTPRERSFLNSSFTISKRSEGQYDLSILITDNRLTYNNLSQDQLHLVLLNYSADFYLINENQKLQYLKQDLNQLRAKELSGHVNKQVFMDIVYKDAQTFLKDAEQLPIGGQYRVVR